MCVYTHTHRYILHVDMYKSMQKHDELSPHKCWDGYYQKKPKNNKYCGGGGEQGALVCYW